MEKIILVTRDELKEVVYEVLEEFFKDKDLDKKKDLPDNMTLEDTVDFLREQGCPTSKSAIYRNTANGSMPFKKYGSRLVFSRKELLEWIRKKTVSINDASVKQEVSEILRRAASRRRK